MTKAKINVHNTDPNIDQEFDNIYTELKNMLGDGGNTNYVGIDTSGNITLKGEAGFICGGMYTNTSALVVITAISDEVEVTGGFLSGHVHGDVTFGGSHYLQVPAAGLYQVNWSMSTSFSSAPGGTREIEVGIMVNGSAQQCGRIHRTMSNSTDIGALAGNCILDLAASAQISLFIQNQSSTNDVTMEHANVTLSQLAG